MGLVSRLRGSSARLRWHWSESRDLPIPDPKLIAMAVRQAWQDNVRPSRKFGGATGWARLRFNEYVQTFLLAYYRRHGQLPEGWHAIKPGGRALLFRRVNRRPTNIP